MQDNLYDALATAVARAHAPGAVAYVGCGMRTGLFEAAGMARVVPRQAAAERSTIYDLASLTKVVATTTALMLLRHEERLDLDRPVGDYLPLPAFSRFTVRHCLTHSAGLVSGLPYYRECVSIDEMLQRYGERDPSWPPGTRHLYSDVGFMILGKVVELIAADALDAFCRKRIFAPLGMNDTTFRPPAEMAGRCAATEDCAWRGHVIAGEVHDENAYALGGVSGHAGLFSTAEDLARFCRAFLSYQLLPEAIVAEMARPGQLPSYPWQGLGWKIDPWAEGNEGFLPSRRALGHTGWTGTSLWMDLDSGAFAILLSNTCHPSRDNRENGVLRRTFYGAVAEQVLPRKSNTHSGLERLMVDDFDAIRGKRLAILTHHAAVDSLGRPLAEIVSLEPSASVVTWYSPEHGLQGQAEAGERIASSQGAAPVVSLYGGQKRPTPEQLKQADLFVVDLQDVGARYYTYAATMLECMKACAASGTPMLVLDRPNPVGGVVLEGPIATDTSHAVCCAPIPVRHGMTLGELALFFQRTFLAKSKLRLEVIRLDGWPRDRLFAECSLPWIPPSPNIPTPETALLYVGTCLFEGTNLNEGRGTETPFEIVGAPWLDPEAVLAAIPPEAALGVALEPAEYTPVAIPGKASDPVFRDQRCQGIRIRIADPANVRAFMLALALIQAIRRIHPTDFGWKDSFNVLAGDPTLRAALERGQDALALANGWCASLEAFDAKRPRLYG